MTTEMSSLLQKLKDNKGAKFASLVYTNNQGETSRYTILIGFSYRNAVEKSLATLSEQAEKMLAGSIEYIAASELIQSFQNTLNGEQKAYTKAHIYENTDIQGVKRNTNDNSLKLFGLVVDKKVISEGEPKKPVKSSEKTIAKHKLSRELPVGKFGEFKLSPESLARMALNGDTIILE